MPDQNWVVLGRLTRPHGIRGEMCAVYYAESYDYFKKKNIMLRAGNAEPRLCTVKSWRPKGNTLIIKFEKIDTRNDAELLRNHEIVMDEKYLDDTLSQRTVATGESDSPQIVENSSNEQEPYLRNIIGLVALLPDGNNLGVIKDIIFPANQEIWIIGHETGVEILFPAVSDFIVRYDLEQGKVYLDPPEGLVDLYLETEKK